MGQIAEADHRPFVLAIVGPTAAGKTAVGVEVAVQLGGEVVSADARQVYRYLDIGTAKPSDEERRRVPHHLIDTIEPTEEYSAGHYAQDSRAAIGAILGRGHLPVVVGGSGLYLRAALDGLFEGPPADPAIRATYETLFRQRGELALREELRPVDPETESRTEWGKPRRLIRALEVHAVTGLPLSELHRRQSRTTPYQVMWVGVAPEREELYRRIDLRVIAMLERGLVEETRGLLERGFARTLNALNTVGYREVFDVLDGATDEQTMVRLIQTHTRQYAKRQMTWFRADGRIHWLERVAQRSPVELATAIATMAKRD